MSRYSQVAVNNSNSVYKVFNRLKLCSDVIILPINKMKVD